MPKNTSFAKFGLLLLFSANSEIAKVTPKISGATSQVSKFGVDLDVDEGTFPYHPAFELIPTDTGRYGISFQLGASGIIEAPDGKKNSCDVLVDMYGSFTEKESPNSILDETGISYQENVTLPGGSPHSIVRIYGFYVKP